MSNANHLTGNDRTIYRCLVRAAADNQPCPGNAELGALVGLTATQASHVVRKLRLQKHIEVHSFAAIRRITITATGESTGVSRAVKKDAGFYIKSAQSVTMQRLQGCDGHHTAILRLYGRMAKERDIPIKEAMWEAQFPPEMVAKARAQHGREMVEASHAAG